MLPFWARATGFWCRLMHGEPMWPMHGRYECRICGRRYRVFWDDRPLARRGAIVPVREAQELVRGGIADTRRVDDFVAVVPAP